MRKIRLYGWLAREFGREFEMDVRTPAEAIRALCHVVKGFREKVRQDTRHRYRILVGSEILDPESDEPYNPAGDTIRIIPVVAGAKDGLLRTVAGIALVVIGAYTKNSYIMSLGVSMMVGGFAQLLAGQPGFDPSLTGGTDKPSYTFAGPVNTVGQGYPVPVAYGKIRVGSAIISGGISSQTFRRDHGAPDEAGTRGGNGDTSPWVWAIAPK